MRLSNRWTFYFLIIWSIPWCYIAAGTCSRTLLRLVDMTPEQYQFTVALIIFSTPLIVLTNFKFNSFGRYFTIVLLSLYAATAISQLVDMLKVGDYGKEMKISIALVVAVINFYPIYYFLGKPYRDRLNEFNPPRQRAEDSAPHGSRPPKKTAARRRRSKKA
jgi:hypothetical protein